MEKKTNDISKKIALLILTMPKFEAEAKLLVKRFNQLNFDLYFPCFLASKNIELFKNLNIRWNLISIDERYSTWGQEMLFALSQIKEQYIFICLDDFYPYSRISPKVLKKYLEKAITFKPSIIRTNNNFNKRIRLNYIKNCIYKESYLHRYGTSLVFPIYKKSFFKSIITSNDTPWSFEKESLSRFDFKKHIFVYIQKVNIRAVNLVVKGKILKSSIRKLPYNLQKEYLNGTHNNLMKREVEILYHIKRFLFRLIFKYFPYLK